MLLLFVVTREIREAETAAIFVVSIFKCTSQQNGSYLGV
jgi:hypothetical protein